MSIVWDDEQPQGSSIKWDDEPSPQPIMPIQTPGQMAAEGMSNFDKLMVGAGRETMGLYHGIRDLLPDSFGGYNDQDRSRISDEFNAYDQGLGDSGWATAGRVLPYLATPTRGVGAGGKIAYETAVNAIPEFLQYKDDMGQRGQDAGIAGVTGIASRFGGDALMDKYAKHTVERGARRAEKVAKRDELEELSDAYDVPLTAGDAGGTGYQKVAEANLEKVPVVGTGGFRETQGRKAEELAGRVNDQWGGQASPEVLSDSLANRFDEFHGEANRLYGDVGRAIDPSEIVPTPKVQQFAADELGKLQGVADEHMPKALTDLYDQWAVNPNMNYDQLSTSLSRLRAEISGLKQSGKFNEARLLEGVASRLDDDLHDFAVSMGADQQADLARAFYRDEFSPLYRPKTGETAGKSINAAMNEDTPERIFKRMFEGKEPSHIAKSWKALDEAGRETVRETVIKRAMDVSAENVDGVFSPAKFAQQLDKDMNIIEAAFHPDEVKMLRDEIIPLMRAARRGGQYLENPPTGARTLVGTGAAAASVMDPTAMLGALGAGMQTFLSTTDLGKAISRGLGATGHGIRQGFRKGVEATNAPQRAGRGAASLADEFTNDNNEHQLRIE